MINEFDIYGTTISCLAPITLEALRLIMPESLGELAIALAFTSEKHIKLHHPVEFSQILTSN